MKTPLKNLPKRSSAFVRVAIVVVIIAVIVVAALLLNKPANLNSVTTIEKLVGKHYVLPTNEQPELATVTDPSKLSAAFLKKSHKGDKILIYQKSQRVIIYRPSIDRIVDVGVVQVNDTAPIDNAVNTLKGGQ